MSQDLNQSTVFGRRAKSLDWMYGFRTIFSGSNAVNGALSLNLSRLRPRKPNVLAWFAPRAFGRVKLRGFWQRNC